MKHPYGWIILIFVFGMSVFSWLCYGNSMEIRDMLIADDGAVQLLGFFFISCTAAIAWVLSLRDPVRRVQWMQVGFLLTIYAAREGDLHRRVSSFAKPTQWKFYFHPDVPATLKLMMFVLALFFAYTLILWVSQNYRHYFEALRHKEPWSQLLLAWILIFPIPQIQEKTPLNDMIYGRAFEEVVEMMAELIAFATVIAFHSWKQRVRR